VKKPKIIAVDFDGTLFTDNYPGIGKPIFETIWQLEQEREHGAKLILWTNRSDGPLKAAIEACNEHGLFFDAVNDNLPEVVERFGCNPRKVFANEYWDDRACHIPHLIHPDKLLHREK
jgi:hydroxymethylpyrimidine pyrophosphatase-like HAD family hydrolase